MMEVFEDRYNELIKYIKGLEKIVVAFSGGVDSTFLLKAAVDALGENVLAVTIVTPYIPKWEIEEAQSICNLIGIKHRIIPFEMIEEIRYNPEDRCYLCKRAIFLRINDLAQKEGYKYVVDGTNYDDIYEYRPGIKALEELEVISPLKECKITKEEIRKLSKYKKLPTWNKPAYACLLTRLPYGEEVKEEIFSKIEGAETVLMEFGYKAVRVRTHGDIARIELNREDTKSLINSENLDKISNRIHRLGFKYVTLDIDGYKSPKK